MAEHDRANGSDSGEIGGVLVRPVFLGNLRSEFTAEQVTEVFEKPHQPPSAAEPYEPFSVERIDLKRGYCFVFLKNIHSPQEKERAERFVSDINGMEVPSVSAKLRSEFARGDGRVKRKEDERRKNIAPSDTLFVVNFHEETTQKEDLEMLFSPFGRLVRIDMKRNYAFVQFRTIEEATKAKEATNGGKLDQSVLTVEYVARQRGDGGGSDRDRGRDRDRGGPRGPPPGPRFDDRGRGDDRRGFGGGRRDDRSHRGGGGRYDEPPPPPRYNDRRRGDSPPPYRGGGGRGSRSRSRSPPPRYGGGYGRSRSPPRGGRYDDRYDDYRDRGPPKSPPDYRGRRGGSPEPPYRGSGGGDRDRGYRP